MADEKNMSEAEVEAFATKVYSEAFGVTDPEDIDTVSYDVSDVIAGLIGVRDACYADMNPEVGLAHAVSDLLTEATYEEVPRRWLAAAGDDFMFGMFVLGPLGSAITDIAYLLGGRVEDDRIIAENFPKAARLIVECVDKTTAAKGKTKTMLGPDGLLATLGLAGA